LLPFDPAVAAKLTIMTRQIRLRLFFAVILLGLTVMSQAQLTRQNAINKVLNQIVVSDTGHINVYAAIDQMLQTDTLHLNFDTCIVLPYTYNWVFFVDDYPGANWTHPCRYISVDSVSGNYLIYSENQFPSGFGDSTNSNYECVMDMKTYPIVQLPENTNYQPTSVAPNPNLYAVIIVTEDANWLPNSPDNRFWYDASLIYVTLKEKYGYTDENIFVHYGYGYCPKNNDDLDNDGINDIDYNATKERILETFENLAGTSTSDNDINALGDDNQLFVYVDGHGDRKNGKSFIYCKASEIYKKLYSDELADAMEDINSAQIISLFQICYSGAFAEELSDFDNYEVQCKNRVIHTATEDNMVSYAERYLTNATYTEFTYYWAAAVRGFYPLRLSPWDISYSTGTFPFDNIYPVEHPEDFDPDLNEDGFVQMEEAFYYADYMDAWSEEGFENHDRPDQNRYEEPVNIDRIGYSENHFYMNNLATLFGLAGGGEDDNTLLPNRNYMVGETITIEDGAYLDIEEGSTLYTTGSNSQFIVKPGGQLQFYDNTTIYNNGMFVAGELRIEDDVTFYDKEIYVNGELDVGLNTSFNELDLELDNINLETTFNTSTFNNCSFSSFAKSLNITSTDFNDCRVVYSHTGDIVVSNSTFDNSWLFIEDQTDNSKLKATVKDSDFSTTLTMAAIDLHYYANFLIENNTIDGYFNGMQIGYSGTGLAGNQYIINNTITNSTVSGIHLYNTTADLSGNYVYNNEYGIKIFDNCNISLQGNQNSQVPDETNYITNNDSYEIYASTGSFPWYFRNNVIIDEDNLGNPNDPMVYYDAPTGGFPLMDVRYNCWGSNFDQSEDLNPTGYMVYPVWCPPSGGNKSSDIALQTYLDGLENFENEEFSEAREIFEEVIELYPNTQYAAAAMKELLAVEKVDGNNFTQLQQYYNTNDSIQVNTDLAKLAGYLSNQCELALENWQTAIDYFEDIIENPDSPQDSIFAIIDLGHTYFLMENSGQKSSAQGSLLQHKPESTTTFSAKRDTLLALLPFKTKQLETETDFEKPRPGKLSQNIPNPFSGKTTVYYNLNQDADVSLKFFDHLGKTVKQLNFASQNEGENKVEINLSGMPAGIYFYSLFVKGQLADTKKMVVK